MKWVRTALLASPVFFSVGLFAPSSVRADDTRPSAPSTRDDWGPVAGGDTTRGSDPAAPGGRESGPLDRELDPGNRREMRNGNGGGGGNGGGVNGGGANGSGNLSDYPGRDVHDWVFANANAATARAIFRRCECDVAAAYRSAQHSFERSKDYHDALAAEREAYDNYNNARQKSLHSLAENGRYRTLMQLRDELGQKLAQRRAARDISREEIIALATLKMNYASDARAMEVEAVNADGSIKGARDKMVLAGAKVAQIRGDYDESLRDNPHIMTAKRNLEDARIALITAQAYYTGATQSATSAMDYAYYLHRNDVGRYDYGGNGYGSGYGSPYWARY